MARGAGWAAVLADISSTSVSSLSASFVLPSIPSPFVLFSDDDEQPPLLFLEAALGPLLGYHFVHTPPHPHTLLSHYHPIRSRCSLLAVLHSHLSTLSYKISLWKFTPLLSRILAACGTLIPPPIRLTFSPGPTSFAVLAPTQQSSSRMASTRRGARLPPTMRLCRSSL